MKNLHCKCSGRWR